MYVWPEALVRPPPDVRLVYLDLNHWIGLAKANTGHRDGHRYHDALATLWQAKSSGGFVFPLSGTHYMEMAGITDPRQRAEVATVMEEFSGFTTLLTLSLLMRLELESSLDLAVGRRPVPYAAAPLLGWGVGPAFGLRGGLRIRAAEGDVTDERRAEWPQCPEAFDAMRADLNLRFERAMLRGPSDAEVAGLRGDGWDPTVARRIAEERATAERELAALLDAEPHLRWGKVRDAVSGRYLSFERSPLGGSSRATTPSSSGVSCRQVYARAPIQNPRSSVRSSRRSPRSASSRMGSRAATSSAAPTST